MIGTSEFDIPGIDEIAKLKWRHELLVNFPDDYRFLGQLIHHKPGLVEESDFVKLNKLSRRQEFLLNQTELACLDLVHAFSKNAIKSKEKKIIETNAEDFFDFQNNLRSAVRSKLAIHELLACFREEESFTYLLSLNPWYLRCEPVIELFYYLRALGDKNRLRNFFSSLMIDRRKKTTKENYLSIVFSATEIENEISRIRSMATSDQKSALSHFKKKHPNVRDERLLTERAIAELSLELSLNGRVTKQAQDMFYKFRAEISAITTSMPMWSLIASIDLSSEKDLQRINATDYWHSLETLKIKDLRPIPSARKSLRRRAK